MLLELLGYVAASLTTVSFLPQAISVIKTKNTQSISLSMYLIFFVGVGFWLVYGALLENIPMILANSITLVLAGIILWYKIHEPRVL